MNLTWNDKKGPAPAESATNQSATPLKLTSSPPTSQGKSCEVSCLRFHFDPAAFRLGSPRDIFHTYRVNPAASSRALSNVGSLQRPLIVVFLAKVSQIVAGPSSLIRGRQPYFGASS